MAINVGRNYTNRVGKPKKKRKKRRNARRRKR